MALGFANAVFGVFGLCQWASKEEMSQEGQGAQNCGVWVQPCCPERLTASELQHGLLEVDRKSHISGTNSPTSNVDVHLGTVHISCRLSPQSQNWVEIVSKSSSYSFCY